MKYIVSGAIVMLSLLIFFSGIMIIVTMPTLYNILLGTFICVIGIGSSVLAVRKSKYKEENTYK